MRIAFIIAHTRNHVVVLFGTLKVQSFMVKIAFGKKKNSEANINCGWGKLA